MKSMTEIADDQAREHCRALDLGNGDSTWIADFSNPRYGLTLEVINEKGLLAQAIAGGSLREIKGIRHSLNADYINALLEMGADVNACGKRGRTPLHNAQTPDLAERLISLGANLNTQDEEGKTPIHYAQGSDVCEVLLMHKADVNIADNDGYTPLHYAPDINNVGKRLLKAGANPNATTVDGHTPLHFAGSVALAQVLLDYGANPSAQNKKGETPRMSASDFWEDGVKQLLLEAETRQLKEQIQQALSEPVRLAPEALLDQSNQDVQMRKKSISRRM